MPDDYVEDNNDGDWWQAAKGDPGKAVRELMPNFKQAALDKLAKRVVVSMLLTTLQ